MNGQFVGFMKLTFSSNNWERICLVVLKENALLIQASPSNTTKHQMFWTEIMFRLIIKIREFQISTSNYTLLQFVHDFYAFVLSMPRMNIFWQKKGFSLQKTMEFKMDNHKYSVGNFCLYSFYRFNLKKFFWLAGVHFITFVPEYAYLWLQ